VALSCLTLMIRAPQPPVDLMGRKPGVEISRNMDPDIHDEEIPGMLIVHAEGSLTFAVISPVADHFNALLAGYSSPLPRPFESSLTRKDAVEGP
jgi:MFS superfamily sulfate permease-like transporter